MLPSRAVVIANGALPVAIGVGVAALGIAAQPWGDFPLNDDWSYAAATRALVDRGRIAYTDWTSMPLFPQLLWGALVVQLFGDGHHVLRIASLVVSSLGLVLFYGAAREAGARAMLAGLATLCLAVNPLWYSLSLSYMTDVYFVTLVSATLWTWLRYLRTGGLSWYALGIVSATLATLQRQLGVALPVALALTLLFRRPRSGALMLRAGLPIIVVGSAHLAYDFHVRHVVGRPAMYDSKLEGLIEVLTHPGFQTLVEVVTRIIAMVACFGLVFAPLALLRAQASSEVRTRSASRPWTAGVLVACMLWLVLAEPPFESIIHASGVGLITLRDSEALRDSSLFRSGSQLAMLTGFAIAYGPLVRWLRDMARSFAGRQQVVEADRELSLFVALATACLLLPLLPGYPFFDRYVLPALPLVGVLLVRRLGGEVKPSRAKATAAWALTLLLAGISLLTAQDNFAWNRARWRAIRDAVQVYGARPEWVDGGFEHNAALNYGAVARRGSAPVKQPPWEDRWVIAFTAPRGYREVRRVATGSWLHPRRDIVLSSRNPASVREVRSSEAPFARDDAEANR